MANRCSDFEGGCTSEGVVLFDAIASALLNSSVCYILDRLRSTVDFEGMTTGFPRATTHPLPLLSLFFAVLILICCRWTQGLYVQT